MCYPQERELQIYQSRECACPWEFPEGYFCYSGKRREWVQVAYKNGLTNSCILAPTTHEQSNGPEAENQGPAAEADSTEGPETGNQELNVESDQESEADSCQLSLSKMLVKTCRSMVLS